MKLPSKLTRFFWRRKSAKIWWQIRFEHHSGYLDPFEYVQYYHKRKWYFCGVLVWVEECNIQRVEFTRWIHAVTVGPPIDVWLTWDQVNEINHKAGYCKKG